MNEFLKTVQRNTQVGVPLLIQSIIFNIMFYCDSFLLGFVGEKEVSAVSAGAQILWLFEALIACPAYVCGALVGRLEGAKRHSEVRTVIVRGFIVTGMISVLSGLAIIIASPAICSAIIRDTGTATMMTTYVRWGTLSYTISTLGTVSEYTLQNMKKQKIVMCTYAAEFITKICVSLSLLFFLRLGIIAIVLGIILSKILRFTILSISLTVISAESEFTHGTSLDYSWKEYIKQCIPLGTSILIWNISTIFISAAFGKMDIAAYTAYALLNNAVYIILIPTESYSKTLSVLVARLFGASSRLSSIYISSRFRLMRYSALLISISSVIIAYLYTLIMPIIQPAISSTVWSNLHTIIPPFLAYIFCKSLTDALTEGFLRPVFDNKFLLTIELIALPCTIGVFTFLPISLVNGFWTLYILELFRLALVIAREIMWNKRGFPSMKSGD